MSHFYANPEDVVAIRLYEEEEGEWHLDGVDEEGRFTEDVEIYDTEAIARENVAAFCEFNHFHPRSYTPVSPENWQTRIRTRAVVELDRIMETHDVS